MTELELEKLGLEGWRKIRESGELERLANVDLLHGNITRSNEVRAESKHLYKEGWALVDRYYHSLLDFRKEGKAMSKKFDDILVDHRKVTVTV